METVPDKQEEVGESKEVASSVTVEPTQKTKGEWLDDEFPHLARCRECE